MQHSTVIPATQAADRLYAQLVRLFFWREQACRWTSVEAAVEARDVVVELSPTIVERALAGDGEVALQLAQAGGEGGVRVLAVDFMRSRDWPHVAAFLQALQDDLELPAPALAVRAHAGYAVWMSLAQPLALADAAAFLEAVRDRYLAELPPAAVTLRPGGAADGGQAWLPLLPARHAVSGHWSAFIDPGLGALFADEPWLEMAPNMGQQADILAPLGSVDAAALARAVEILAASAVRCAEGERKAATLANTPADASPVGARRKTATLALGGGFADPADFLLALMNDPSASARQRIAAAKALLPFYRNRKA